MAIFHLLPDLKEKISKVGLSDMDWARVMNSHYALNEVNKTAH